MIIRKKDVELHLGYGITDRQYKKALEQAIRKQAHAYRHEKRPEIMQSWYLTILTAEAVEGLALSDFTSDLCNELRNMEKEHPVKNQGAPTSNHIVANL